MSATASKVAAISPPAAAFNKFLYAEVADDKNGMVLTLLSMFARQNVDPWEQAADLGKLPLEKASQKLASMLEALPGHASLADRILIAGRLLPLLPRVSNSQPREHALRRVLDVKRFPAAGDLSTVLIYLAMMIAGEWIFATYAMTPPVDVAAVRSAVATPAASATTEGAPR